MKIMMLVPSCLKVLNEVSRLMLWEVTAVVLMASCVMGCEWSCSLVILRKRVDEKPKFVE